MSEIIRWKYNCRMVAWSELAVLITVYLTWLIGSWNNKKTRTIPEYFTNFSYLSLLDFSTVAELYTTILLIKATKLKTDPTIALKWVKMWRLFGIILFLSLLLFGAYYLLSASYHLDRILMHSVWIFIRGVWLWIGSKFINELERVVAVTSKNHHLQ